jgi:hypothetical protein
MIITVCGQSCLGLVKVKMSLEYSQMCEVGPYGYCFCYVRSVSVCQLLVARQSGGYRVC